MLGPALTLAAYLLGSVSFGLMMASGAGVDLRGIGSGNTGATNVGRALGKSSGRKVLLLDMLKGFIPVFLARWAFELPWPWITAVGISAAVGHCYPIWHGFRGGKGAATAAGVMLAALPLIGVATLLAFVVVKKLSQRTSVASLASATLAPLMTMAFDGRQWPIQLAMGLWVLVLWRHSDNIVRLLKGEEPPG